MKTTVKIIVIIPVLFAFFFATANKNAKQKEIKEYELELKFSFPSKDLEKEEIYFFGASHICSDSTGNIYISDSKARTIFKFDSSGNFLIRIGREGQGPGEFNNPRRICLLNDSLIVSDNNNRRIQILDKNGIYIKSVKLKGMAPWDIAVNDNGLIFVAPLRMQSEAPLIDVYSQEGELLYSFGEPIDLEYSWNVFNQALLATDKEGKLLVAFAHWPIIRKYSEEGELEAEYRIEDKIMKDNENFNLKQQKPKPKGQPTRSKPVINSFYLMDDNFYLLRAYPQIEILEFANNAEQKAVYKYYPEDKYLSTDFLIVNRVNKKFFYVLQRNPENRVDVFGIKKN